MQLINYLKKSIQRLFIKESKDTKSDQTYYVSSPRFENKDDELIGMPSVLARHHNWGKQGGKQK